MSDRRKFLSTLLATTFVGPTLIRAAGTPAPAREIPALEIPSGGLPAGIVPSIRHIIEMILAEIPGAPFKQTVDTIKSGNPDQPVTGIITTMFATDAVIDQAIREGANFIIAHEPTFYNHLDETEWLGDDKVYRYKKDKLEAHGIVVWRFHDYWHAHRPDGISMGVLTALGWEKYYDASTPGLVVIPPVSLRAIIELAKKRMDIEKVKMIGDLSQSCSRIAISPGAGGGKSQIGSINRWKPDVFICGEINEWETAEYIRDARYQGEKTALVVLGHAVSEEPGMQWLVGLLQPKLPGVKIIHTPSGDPHRYI